MSKSSMTNIPAMAVGKMVDKLSQSYCTIIQKGLPVKTMPSVMLWGPPGVGKSQAVRQIAKIIERNTEKVKYSLLVDIVSGNHPSLKQNKY